MAAGLTLYSEPPLCIPIGALFQINLRVRCGHLPTQVPFFAGSQYDAARILFRDAALGLWLILGGAWFCSTRLFINDAFLTAYKFDAGIVPKD
jgi:hypothetical protein